jgi:hypothetical protein
VCVYMRKGSLTFDAWPEPKMPAKPANASESLSQHGLSGHSDCALRRARVPGGWLALFHEPYGRESGSITFYPEFISRQACRRRVQPAA